MNKFFIYSFLGIAMLGSSVMAAEHPVLKTYQETYLQNIVKNQDTLAIAKKKNRASAYQQLANLESSYKNAGKLKELLALRELLKKRDSSLLEEEKLSPLEGVQQVLDELQKNNEKVQGSYQRSIASLQKSYGAALLKKVKSYTQKDELEVALLFQHELDELKKNVKANILPDVKGLVVSKVKPIVKTPSLANQKLIVLEDAKFSPLENLDEGSEEAQNEQRRLFVKGKPLEVQLARSGIRFRLIPAGEFMMGDIKSKDEANKAKLARVEKAFYMGTFEVTQKQWKLVMGNNPSAFQEVGDNGPVETVSWDHCQEFIEKLISLEKLTAGSIRLPSEVEREFACRAGTKGRYYVHKSKMSEVAWFDQNSDKKTHEVGQKWANAYGLYDMHGNVDEWCSDKNSEGRPIVRGGSWRFNAWSCASMVSSARGERERNTLHGLRLVLDLEKVGK